MIDFPHLREQLNETGIAYLLLDLELGSTFARLAFDSSDPAKKDGYHINARKAYDSVSLLVKRVCPSAAQSAQLEAGLTKLKAELTLLGELI